MDEASVFVHKTALEPVLYPEKKPLDLEVIQKMRPMSRRFFEPCDKYGIDRRPESREDIGAGRNRLKGAFRILEGDAF